MIFFPNYFRMFYFKTVMTSSYYQLGSTDGVYDCPLDYCTQTIPFDKYDKWDCLETASDVVLTKKLNLKIERILIESWYKGDHQNKH